MSIPGAKELESELATVKAENARLRAALEEISDSGNCGEGAFHLKGIARRALEGES